MTSLHGPPGLVAGAKESRKNKRKHWTTGLAWHKPELRAMPRRHRPSARCFAHPAFGDRMPVHYRFIFRALRSLVRERRGEELRSIRRPLALGGAILGLILLTPLTHALGANGPGSRPAPPTCPAFSSGNFHKSTTINNPYFPVVPGTRFTYNGNVQNSPAVDVVTVTHNTPTIDGVKTIEVRDQVSEGGVPTEDTLDWYAQDDQGNVWYFGELATQLPAGTDDGSWAARVAGAQPGDIMGGGAEGGGNYCPGECPGGAQERAPGAEVR